MVYRGKVQNGQIVLEPGTRLPEGMDVEISPAGNGNQGTKQPKKGSYEAIEPFIGIWADQAEDMERSRQELRAMKDEEIRRQKMEPDPEL